MEVCPKIYIFHTHSDDIGLQCLQEGLQSLFCLADISFIWAKPDLFLLMKLVDLGQEGIDEMLVHSLSLPQGVQVDRTVLGDHFKHIWEEQEDGLLVDLEEFLLGQEQSRPPEEVVALVEGRFIV